MMTATTITTTAARAHMTGGMPLAPEAAVLLRPVCRSVSASARSEHGTPRSWTTIKAKTSSVMSDEGGEPENAQAPMAKRPRDGKRGVGDYSSLTFCPDFETPPHKKGRLDSRRDSKVIASDGITSVGHEPPGLNAGPFPSIIVWFPKTMMYFLLFLPRCYGILQTRAQGDT